MPRDPLHRLLVVNLISGASIGVIFVSGLLWVDAFGLRAMLTHDVEGLVALAILCGGFVLLIASVVAGTAVMMDHNPGDDDDDRGGPGIRELIPIRVKARR